MFKSIQITALIILSISGTAHSLEEHPTTGILRNTIEASSLTYDCKLTESLILECEFVQVALRNLKSQSEADIQYKKKVNEKIDWKKEVNPKDCFAVSEYLESIVGTKPATEEQLRLIKMMSNTEKQDLTLLFKAYTKVCKTKNAEDLHAVQKLYLDKEVRSCNISTNKFSQSFQLVSDGDKSKVWVVRGEPFGECGLVQLSRFVPAHSKTGEINFWNYVAKKIVTNKNGKTEWGISCKDFDENEYEYAWQSKVWTKGCDYIEFAP